MHPGKLPTTIKVLQSRHSAASADPLPTGDSAQTTRISNCRSFRALWRTRTADPLLTIEVLAGQARPRAYPRGTKAPQTDGTGAMGDPCEDARGQVDVPFMFPRRCANSDNKSSAGWRLHRLFLRCRVSVGSVNTRQAGVEVSLGRERRTSCEPLRQKSAGPHLHRARGRFFAVATVFPRLRAHDRA